MKNQKNMQKGKKRSRELFDIVKLHSDYDYFHMKNSEYFLTFTDRNNEDQVSNGIDIVENIIILPKNYNDNLDFKSSLSYFKKEKKIKDNFHSYSAYNNYIAQRFSNNNDNNINYFIEHSDNIATINFIDNNISLVSLTNNLKVAKTKKEFDSAKLDLSQIIYINEHLSLTDLIKLYKIAIEIKMKYFEYLKLPEHIQDSINNNESIILACKSPIGFKKGENQDLMKLISYAKDNYNAKEDNNNNTKENNYTKSSADTNNTNKNKQKNILSSKKLNSIEKELVETMVKSCKNSLKKINLSFGILDYILAEGVTIDSLVEAGMELCVGIEETPEKINELKIRLKKEILKSLEDLNVIALLMSAIRCEEDFQSNRLREVDVSDDPAYLYTDEVLGIAMANQIAGTKATFNFKRYDEEKPGIISELGPMVDDIFAGLIAGCMSKIFEEDY